MNSNVSATSKSCHVCGSDVSHTKRVKDTAGNYYCMACWKRQFFSGQAVPISKVMWRRIQNAKLRAATQMTYLCRECHQKFDFNSVYSDTDGSIICKSCWQMQSAGIFMEPLPDGLELLDAEPDSPAVPALEAPTRDWVRPGKDPSLIQLVRYEPQPPESQPTASPPSARKPPV